MFRYPGSSSIRVLPDDNERSQEEERFYGVLKSETTDHRTGWKKESGEWAGGVEKVEEASDGTLLDEGFCGG